MTQGQDTSPDQSQEASRTVVDRVLEDLLERLLETGVADTEMVARLRVALLEKRLYTLDALQEALFAEGVG